MPVKYSPAPQVERVARPLIEVHHAHLITNKVYVEYLFTSEAEKVKGKSALGTARKVSGLNAFLALLHDDDAPEVDDFFLICVWGDWWKSRSTTDEQRKALVDHELSHLWSEEKTDKSGNPLGVIDLSLLPHDLEEFNAIVDRHGAWEPAIEEFLAAYNGEGDNLFSGTDHGQKDTTVTLTTRQGSVTLSADKLQEQAERSRA